MLSKKEMIASDCVYLAVIGLTALVLFWPRQSETSPSELPPPAVRPVLKPISRQDFLQRINQAIAGNEASTQYATVLYRYANSVDHRIRVYYYRNGIYFIADPAALSDEENRERTGGLATFIRENAPGYKGHFLLCASKDTRHRILKGWGKLPRISGDRSSVMQQADFFGMTPDLIDKFLESRQRNKAS